MTQPERLPPVVFHVLAPHTVPVLGLSHNLQACLMQECSCAQFVTPAGTLRRGGSQQPCQAVTCYPTTPDNTRCQSPLKHTQAPTERSQHAAKARAQVCTFAADRPTPITPYQSAVSLALTRLAEAKWDSRFVRMFAAVVENNKSIATLYSVSKSSTAEAGPRAKKNAPDHLIAHMALLVIRQAELQAGLSDRPQTEQVNLECLNV